MRANLVRHTIQALDPPDQYLTLQTWSRAECLVGFRLRQDQSSCFDTGPWRCFWAKIVWPESSIPIEARLPEGVPWYTIRHVMSREWKNERSSVFGFRSRMKQEDCHPLQATS